MEYAIETDGLRKHYDRGKVKALQDVSLSVPRGCCFGLLGPNGAGKSTLVKSLLSIVRPTAGTGKLLGRDIRKPAARRGVGYLPEGHAFPKYLTGKGVCNYFGRLAGLSGSELKREIEEKLALVELSDRANDKVTKYSKGMKQRVGLAQAMLGNPELIFLDEPTDGVDPMGRKAIRQIIRQITDQGTTVFLNSHLLGEIEQMCDRIAILNKGQLLQEGTVEEIKGSLNSEPGLEVKFETSVITAEIAAQLDLPPPPEGQTFLQVRLPDREQIPPYIDRLRNAGVSIYEVSSVTVNLEDAFVQVITRDGEEA